jgi:sigma-B regulation protein RsbU (phosphoserine phosphatase)
VGALADAHTVTTTVRLAPGDTLLLYTDGLTEAHTALAGDRYGDEALLDFARDLAPTTASAAVEAIRALLDSFGTGVDDDTAVLAINVHRPADEPQS